MGLILAARHLQLEERVALKFLLAPNERVAEFEERFLREARITAKLRGAHVARTMDYGVTDEGDPFIVMEYLEGLNLRQLLRESGPLPLDVVVNYVLQACEGLAEAHRDGVVHRDLKPANLFLTKHLDGGDLLKILDFGVSKLRNFAAVQSDLTEEGAILGSPKYMAIEQLQQAGDVDERADIWSLGAITYEMFTGHPPFDGNSTAAVCMAIMGGGDPKPLSQIRPELPIELDGVVGRCLSRDLFTRTPNVAVLARELAEASGLDGLESAVQAVEDVVAQQPLSPNSSRQVRSFGQTGAHATSTGRYRVFGDGESGARSRDAAAVAEEVVPGADTNGRLRTLLIAVAGLAVLGGLAAYFFARGEARPPMIAPSSATSTAAVAAAPEKPDTEVASPTMLDASVDAGQDAEKDDDASDGPPDAAPDAKRKAAVWGPPGTPPPATHPPSTTATAATKKRPQDAFGSRY